MARSREMQLDEFLSLIRSRIKRDFSVGIESRSTLTDHDVEILRKLKSLRARGSRRDAETEARRAKLLDCLLEHGATSGLYRAMREVERSFRCRRKVLPDLWSSLPRRIVKRWVENAETRGDNGVVGNLVCFAYDQGDHEILLRMFDYGVNCQTKNHEGTELVNSGNKCAISLTLGLVHRHFAQAEAGLELDLNTRLHDRFLAKVHARDSRGCTILQLALKNGHLHTATQIVSSIIHQMPKTFTLDVSETMGYDELVAGCKLCLSELNTRLEGLIDQENVFLQALSLFNAAARLLLLWQKYESGMDRFFSEPHLAIIDETLEVLGFGQLLSANRSARCHEIWLKQTKYRDAKSFIVSLVRRLIIAPIVAFSKVIYGSKLHQAADLNDLVTAAECIQEDAKLDLIDRRGDMKLLQRVIERGDEVMATLLLDSKVDPRIDYDNRHSLLHLAVQKGKLAVVKSILRNFGDPDDRRDYMSELNDGLTPLQLAEKLGHVEICNFLMKYLPCERIQKEDCSDTMSKEQTRLSAHSR